jgi:hypothetical protein
MKRVLFGLIVTSLLLVMIEIALRPASHLIPGGYALFAVAGCVAIVRTAKLLATIGLQRPDPADRPRDV